MIFMIYKEIIILQYVRNHSLIEINKTPVLHDRRNYIFIPMVKKKKIELKNKNWYYWEKWFAQIYNFNFFSNHASDIFF